jgi:hypothetical protein
MVSAVLSRTRGKLPPTWSPMSSAESAASSSGLQSRADMFKSACSSVLPTRISFSVRSISSRIGLGNTAATWLSARAGLGTVFRQLASAVTNVSI